MYLMHRLGTESGMAETIAMGVSAKRMDMRNAAGIDSVSRNMDDMKFLVAALGTVSEAIICLSSWLG